MKNGVRRNAYAIWSLALASLVTQTLAYEVWIGTHLMRGSDVENLSEWELTASLVSGLNINRAPHDTDPAGNQGYRTIFEQFTGSRNAIHGFARSEATRDPSKVDELAFPAISQRLEELFSAERTFGYDLTDIMFYDERGTFQGTEYLYVWTDIEIQYLRDWLDDNGHADVELKWNVRNNSLRNRQVSEKAIVDSVEIEASTTALLNNTNNQITYFNWFWNNPVTADKEIVLQIPRTLDSLDQFKGTRRVAKLIGDEIGYGDDGMRSDRLVFLPVTYNDRYDFRPETVSNGTAYTNTLSSIALSLIEQRSLFEGYSRLPTNNDADNTTRLFPPTVGVVADQVLESGASTGALEFSVSDDETPSSSLTINKETSNPTLIPEENIVLGGSGDNRTVTITPAPDQSGTSEIELWVSDGTLASPVAFSVTVLPPGSIPGVMLSESGDGSIKESPALENVSSETVSLGARGGAPWVERCTVYVFELPNLGMTSNPFEEASFQFEFVDKNATLRGHDLYGLGRRSSPQLQTSDFYSQSATADPSDATRLQQSILTNSTPTGLITTSAGGGSNLVSYLNAQYAGGAGIGEYVFLRINTREPKLGVNYATLTMSEGGVIGEEDTRPQIAYRAVNPGPSITSIPNQTLGLNVSTGALPFTVDSDSTPVGLLTVSADSDNLSLVPEENIVIGGSGTNRTVTVTPTPNMLGSALITIEVSDGTFSSDTAFLVTVEGVQEVMPGWDSWNSATAPAATLTGSGITASATASTSSGNWTTSDQNNDGRGSSGDGSWGSFAGNGATASTATTGAGVNMTATNGKTDAQIVFTLNNNGPGDWKLDSFHMDAFAFRPNAPRTYQLEVISGDLSNGVVFTSGNDEINHVGGDLSANHDDHDQIDIDLSGLADSTLESGGTAVVRIAFSSGTGSGDGHHLFMDNVAFSGSQSPLSGLQQWRFQYFETIENRGTAADDFDANFDGESNIIEFVTNQSPLANSLASTLPAINDGRIQFRYVRSKAAIRDGVTFQVEWSDTLAASEWSTEGVVDVVDPEHPANDEMENRVATVPVDDADRRFIRLRVIVLDEGGTAFRVIEGG